MSYDRWYEGSRIGLVTEEDLYLLRPPSHYLGGSYEFEFDEEGLEVYEPKRKKKRAA